MRIVVTGADGALGRGVAARLISLAHDVVGIGVRRPESWPGSVDFVVSRRGYDADVLKGADAVLPLRRTVGPRRVCRTAEVGRRRRPVRRLAAARRARRDRRPDRARAGQPRRRRRAPYVLRAGGRRRRRLRGPAPAGGARPRRRAAAGARRCSTPTCPPAGSTSPRRATPPCARSPPPSAGPSSGSPGPLRRFVRRTPRRQADPGHHRPARRLGLHPGVRRGPDDRGLRARVPRPDHDRRRHPRHSVAAPPGARDPGGRRTRPRRRRPGARRAAAAPTASSTPPSIPAFPRSSPPTCRRRWPVRSPRRRRR